MKQQKKAKTYPKGFEYTGTQTCVLLGITPAQLRQLKDQGALKPVRTVGKGQGQRDYFGPEAIDKIRGNGGVAHLLMKQTAKAAKTTEKQSRRVIVSGESIRLARIEGLLREIKTQIGSALKD